jgi:phage-related holin
MFISVLFYLAVEKIFIEKSLSQLGAKAWTIPIRKVLI